MKALLTLTIILMFSSVIAHAEQLEDLQRDLREVRLEMRAASAEVEAAIEKIQRLRGEFPRLQAREKELIEKLQALEKKEKESPQAQK